MQKFDEHNKYYFSSREDMRDFTAGWAKQFLDKIHHRYLEAKHLVLKHPPLTPRFPALFELLTSIGIDVQFYVIVRDPRDVAASLVEVGERLRKKGESEGNTLPRDMNLLGNYYMKCYMPALTFQNEDYQKRITIIKYEDLVRNPQAVIETIRNKSDLTLDEFNATEGWKRNDIDYKELKGSNNAWLSDLWGEKLSTARIGQYKKILTAGEIALLEKVCTGPMATFKYG